MLKKTITYTDYNDNERTEDFYFNLSKAEVTEMELSTTGGLAEMIQRMVDVSSKQKRIEKHSHRLKHIQSFSWN